MDIVLSIHPEWAGKIYSQEKIYEYRKTFPDNYNVKNDICCEAVQSICTWDGEPMEPTAQNMGLEE